MDHSSLKSEEGMIYCANCNAALPGNAAFCIQCGRPQRRDIIEARLAMVRDSYRTTMRGMMLVIGVIALIGFVSMALRFESAPWGDLYFWTGTLVIFASFIILPVVLWRDKSGNARQKIEVKRLLPM